MIIKDFMQVVQYRITEGSEYCWTCFGNNAYCLTSWNGEQDGYSVNIVFDTKTQEVYQLEVCDYSRNRAYRWTSPAHMKAYKDEAKTRNVNDFAFETDDGKPVNYIDLEVEEDFLDKAYAIVNDEDYDERIQIPLDLNKDELYNLMLQAHERDITLNQLVSEVLEARLDKMKSGDPDEF